MPKPESAARPPRHRARRWAIALLLVLLLPLVVLFVASFVVDPNTFRPLLAGLSERYTGLPTQIGALSWHLGLRPSVTADDVQIGDEAFGGRVRAATATLDLRGLLRGTIVIDRIAVEDAQFHFPETPAGLFPRIQAIIDAATGPPDASPPDTTPAPDAKSTPQSDAQGSGGPVEIRLIEARNVSATMAGREALRGDVLLRDVTANTLRIEVDWALPYFAEDARFDARLGIGTTATAPFDGTAHAQGIDLHAWAREEDAPHARLNFDTTIAGFLRDGVAIDVKGALGAAENHALDGEFNATALLTFDAIAMSAFEWETPDLHCDASGRYGFDGALAGHATEWRMDAEALKLLFTYLDPPGYDLSASDDATVNIQAFDMAWPSGAPPQFEQGTAVWKGITVRTAGGDALLPNLRGEVAIEEGAVQIKTIATDHLELAGRVVPDLAARAARVDLTAKAKLDKAALSPFLDLSAVERLGGALTVSRFQATLDSAGGLPKDLSITATLADVVVATKPNDETPALEATLNGGIQMQDSVITLDKLRGSGLAIDGTITPDFKEHTYALALQGNLDLGSALVAVFIPSETIRDLHGSLKLDEARGTWDAAGGLPTDLVLEGSLKDVSASVSSAGFSDELRDGSGNFKTEGDHIQFDLQATGVASGPLQLIGSYQLAEAVLKASGSADLAQLAAPLLPEGDARAVATALLAAYGKADLQLNLELDRTDLRLAIDKTTEPAFTATANFTGAALGDMAFETQVPLDGLNDATGLNLQGAGPASITFSHEAKSGAFHGAVDLSAARLGYAPYVTKPAGEHAEITVAGNTSTGAWKLDQIEIAVFDQHYQLAMREDNLAMDETRIDLGALSPLLGEGRSISGNVTGRFTLDPLEFALLFDGAAITLNPDAALSNITGGLHYRAGAFQLDDLHLSGADSDCTINASIADQHINGSIHGTALNLNALDALWQAVQPGASRAPATPDATSESSDANATAPEAPQAATLALDLAGDLSIQLDRVRYRQGQLNHVRANLHFLPGGVRIDDLHAEPGAGKVTGQAQLYNTTDAVPAHMTLQLELADADAAALDALLNPEQRGLRGLYTGNIDLQFPLGNARQVCNDLNGTIQLDAKDGSFGKFGFATKLLSLLRATEVFRLRLPPTGDEGVAFNAFTTRIKAEDGVLKISDTELTNTSYNLGASGDINFPKDTLLIHVATNPLELVTGVAGNVPLLGRGVDKLLEGRGVQIRVSGSPWDPHMSIETTPKIVRDVGGVLKGTVDGVGRLFGGGKKD